MENIALSWIHTQYLQRCPFCQVLREYVQKHFLHNRRNLPADHRLGFAIYGHIRNAVELRSPLPPPPSLEEIRGLCEEYNSLPSKNRKDKFTKKHGVKCT